jgi:peptidyl-prolyl cis-trans isomerase B (cyclophilin B)
MPFFTSFYLYGSFCENIFKIIKMKAIKQIVFFVVLACAGTLASCSNTAKNSNSSVALIKTDYGNIKVKLYEKTPEHRKNFVELTEEDFYDGLLFHRVIENFMIQGGDPDSKDAEPGKRLGGGSLDYTLPAEFVAEYYHKRGAVAAARRGGASNPEKRSSASQFYIVQGKVFTPGQLDTLEMTKNARHRKEIVAQQIEAHRAELEAFRENNDREGFNVRLAEIREEADSLMEANGTKFEFTDEQREIYTTIGGYPSLDGDYTVFGEVVEGMDVVDKIAAVETDEHDRPVEDVKMEVELVK